MPTLERLKIESRRKGRSGWGRVTKPPLRSNGGIIRKTSCTLGGGRSDRFRGSRCLHNVLGEVLRPPLSLIARTERLKPRPFRRWVAFAETGVRAVFVARRTLVNVTVVVLVHTLTHDRWRRAFEPILPAVQLGFHSRRANPEPQVQIWYERGKNERYKTIRTIL
jgi:hypothetical protein